MSKEKLKIRPWQQISIKQLITAWTQLLLIFIIQKHSQDGQTSIKQISFFDDSQKNLDDVMELRDKYPNIDIAIEKVDHDEITSLEEEL